MPKLKRNHFVSQGHIRFWAGNDDRVLLWGKGLGSIRLELRNPRSVHSLDYLYAKWSEDGARDSSAEVNLKNEIDDHVPSFVNELIMSFEQHGAFILTPTQRAFLSRWVVRSLLRNPAIIDLLSSAPTFKVYRAVMRLARWFGRRLPEDKAFLDRGKDRVLLGEFITSIVTANVDDHVARLSKMGFHFIIPDSHVRSFALGSQPFLIQPNTGDENGLGPMTFFIIHPRIMVGFWGAEDGNEVIVFDDEDMKRVNGLIAKYCGSIVVRSDRDIDDIWWKPYGMEDQDEMLERVRINGQS